MTSRVLMICGEYPPVLGGIPDYTQLLATGLARRGTDVSVLTSLSQGIPRESIEEGVRVLRTMAAWGLRDLGRILRIVEEAGDGAVVHIQYPGVAFRRNPMINLLPAILRARRPAVPVVITVHDARAARLRRRVRMAPMLSVANAIVRVDEPDAPYLDSWTWFNRPLSACIRIGPTVPPIPATEDEREAWRLELGLDGGEPVVAFFGMLYPHKGLPELVEAVRTVRRRGIGARLLVIGDFDRVTPFEVEVTDLLRKPKEEGWAVWLRGGGAVAASRALHASDLVALPFHSGAASNRSSLLSALAHRLRTITTRGPATPADFESHFPVSLVPVRDAAALALAILRELERGRPTEDEFRDRWAAIIPSWQQISEQQAALYAELRRVRRSVA
jgi:glycosyltransferase involved in cell wall biosynthesis